MKLPRWARASAAQLGGGLADEDQRVRGKGMKWQWPGEQGADHEGLEVI